MSMLYTWCIDVFGNSHTRNSKTGCSIITPQISLPWALTMCQIMHKISGWRQHTIAIVMATHSQSPLAGAPVLCFSQGGCSFIKHRNFYIKLLTLLQQFSCLLWIVSMHDQAIIVGCSYVQWNVPGCKHSLVCWHAKAAWTLAIRDCKDLAWALTREWAFSILAA